MTLDPKTIAAILLSERPDRDGTKWSDGARDEWSTVVLAFDRALSAAHKEAGESYDYGSFLNACGYR
jgi:hypothetical protein